MKEDKAIQELVDSLFKEDSLASPSPDFTKNVMARLKQEEASKVSVSSRLPKWPLLVPAVFFILCVIYVLNTMNKGASPDRYTLILDTVDLSILDISRFFNFSDSFAYIVIMICVAICLQTIVLKKQFDRRFA